MLTSRRLLVIPALIIVLLEFGAVLYALPTQQNNNTGIGFASIYVYKNGRLVFYDPDDPPTNNWAYAVAGLLTGSNNPLPFKDTDGTQHKYIVTVAYATYHYLAGKSKIWLIISSDVQFYSSIYEIASGDYIDLQIDDSNYYVDETSHTAQGSVSYTYLDSTTGNLTIYGVAFVSHDLSSMSSSSGYDVLLFVDLFDTPITLQYNDTVTITYKFNMKIP